jgi:hypothetical protein
MKNWLFLAAALLMATTHIAHGTEEPSWQLVEQLGEVEVRQYDGTIQARTPMKPGDSSTRSFRRLANYIFGGNDDDMSIAMTAPVEQSLGEEDGYMAFTMPAEHSMEDLPKPNDGTVSLHPLPARTVAVITFSGLATSGRVEEKTAELLTTLDAQGIDYRPRVSLNQYDPPWTVPWKRRNEIMVELGAVP